MSQAILMFVVYLVVVYLPFIAFSDQILRIVGLSEDISNGYYDIAWKALLGDFFDCWQIYLMQFCNSQQIESVFAPLTWINLIISVPVVIYLDRSYGLSFDAWIAGRLMFYFLCTVTFLVIYLKQTNKRSLGFCHFHEAFKGFLSFVQGSLSLWIGNVLELISWESGTYFNGLSNNASEIAAFVSMMNVVYLMFDIGSGFLISSRTRVNYLLGANMRKSTKTLLILALLNCFVTCVGLGLVLYFVK